MGQDSGHGSYHGSMSVEDEDDVEELSPIKPKKPSRRATKAKDKGKQPEPTKKVEAWSKAEEVALCRAFIFISENSAKGNAANRNRFWKLVIEYFIKETGSDRTYDSIMSKWKTRIRNRVENFCALMDNVKDKHESGENDADDYSKGVREYRLLYGDEFTLEDCWKVLTGHDAWKREMPAFQSGSRKKTNVSTTTSGSTQGPMNFQDVDDSDDEEDTRESRP